MPYGQSPWEGAAQSAQGMGQSMGSVGLQLARVRYMQAMEQQRQAIAMGKMAMQHQHYEKQDAMRQALNDAQIAHYKAQSGQAQSGQALNAAKLQSANSLGDVAWNQNMPRPSGDIEEPLGDVQGAINTATKAQGVARNQALYGKAGQMQVLGQNTVGVDPGTGQLGGMGLRNVPPGNLYNETPGAALQQAPFAPRVGNQPKSSAVDTQLIGGLAKGTIDPQTEESDPNQIMLWNAATNALARAANPMMQGPTPQLSIEKSQGALSQNRTTTSIKIMKSPTGQSVKVPQDRVDWAKQQGYSE